MKARCQSALRNTVLTQKMFKPAYWKLLPSSSEFVWPGFSVFVFYN